MKSFNHNTLFAFIFYMTASLAFAASNPFEVFIGEYDVVSANCTRNGTSTSEGCDQIRISIQSRASEGILEIKEVFQDGAMTFPLFEREYSDQYGSERAWIEAGRQTRWLYSQSIYDGRRIFEVRQLQKISENEFSFTFYHKERNTFGNEFLVERKYVIREAGSGRRGQSFDCPQMTVPK